MLSTRFTVISNTSAFSIFDCNCSGSQEKKRRGLDPTAVITSVHSVCVVPDGGHVVGSLTQALPEEAHWTGGWCVIQRAVTACQWGQMAGRSQRPTKRAHRERLGSFTLLRRGHEQLVLPVRSKKPFPTGLCCLTFGLVVFMSGLVLASIYVYRYYFIPQQIPEDSLFHCRVIYEDSVYAPLRGRQELEENVGIYLEDNYEQISVPVPHFGGSDPADIIHDFQRGLTAYYDIALDKCYITELNTTLVMPPRNLWELLVNVKRGTYLPQTYIIQEEMMVTGRVRNMRQLGPFIHRLCYGKETYRLRRHNQRRRIERRETKKCHSIRHFENTFVVETVICDRL